MNGFYGYCVVPADHSPPDKLIGLSDAPVRLLNAESIGLWVSQLERTAASLEAIKAHNSVVEAAITDDVTPVPLRFGQWLDDDQAWRAALQQKSAWYEERLTAFAGALEFGIRILDPARESSARVVRAERPASGREYMQALRAQSAAAQLEREQQERLRARINEIVSDVVREERIHSEISAHTILIVSHLVAREYFTAYRQRAARIRQALPELRFLFSGPWVPYSFAE